MYIVSIVNHEDRLLTTKLFKSKNNAINFIEEDLRYHEMIDDNSSDYDKERFEELVKRMKSSVENTYMFDDEPDTYYLDEINFED